MLVHFVVHNPWQKIKFPMVSEAVVAHTGLSLDHKFMPSATNGVFKLDYHHLTETTQDKHGLEG